MTLSDNQALAERFAAVEGPTLAAAVHRGDRDTIAAVLGRLDRQDLVALTVVLAAEIVIDDISVERVALDGERERLTRPERAAAVALLADRGHTQTDIGRRLHLNGTATKRLVTALTDGLNRKGHTAA
ncbi:hypothetical protein [Actinomadura macra]|uniref:hypothetical protein n=1 Tax=Actinomadura macra TaxID=46164 RepID=UPI00082D749A|nr:hypothetical protein [Actinomadura macra]